jgi:adenylate cyclase
MLNEYFSLMVDVLMSNGGILDKYIGDAIMAVFGAPFPGERDADNAVLTGIGMLKALRELNQKRHGLGQDPIEMGIGINTDEVLSGNIGSLKRMDFTVIGDGVNLASRLEGANKPYGTQLLISEFTKRILQGSYLLREVDLIRVKGKNAPVGIFEVMDHYDLGQLPHLTELLSTYQAGLEHYRRKEWHQAKQIFSEVLLMHPNDSVSRLYKERCFHFIEHPPGDDWDGVWTMKSK